MSNLAIVIRKAPYGQLEAAEGVRHLCGSEPIDFKRIYGIFIDDGVYTLAKGQLVPASHTSLQQWLETLEQRDVGLFCESGSATARGLEISDLVEGVEMVESVADLIAGADKVLIF